MSNIVIAAFTGGSLRASICGETWQWDYGQILRIQGLQLPAAVEVHFAPASTVETESIRRVGVTKDGVTDVPIPDSILEESGSFKAYIYLTDPESGQTEYAISGRVKAREKPEGFESQETADLFRAAIEAVKEAAAEAAESERQAEGYAHGREDLPERTEDNARYYSQLAADAAKQIPGEVQAAKQSIDAYVADKEASLKGETGNVYFASFRVVAGRLKMYSDPAATKIAFLRHGSRLAYRAKIGG